MFRSRPSKELRTAALVTHSPHVVPPGDGPSVLSRLLHPKQNIHNKKRRKSSGDSNAEERQTKRVRGGLQGPPDADVIVIDDDDDEKATEGQRASEKASSSADSMDPVKVLNLFRVNQTKLK